MGATSGPTSPPFTAGLATAAGVLALTAQLRTLGYVCVTDPFFGAVGDGSDERAKVQAAIDFVNAAGGGRVRGLRSKTFVAGSAGTKTFKNSVGSNYTANYCLELKSNVVLERLNLKLAAAADACLLSNPSPTSPGTDTGFGFIDCMFDGNGNVTTVPFVLFQNATAFELRRSKLKNACCEALQTSACSDFDLDQLRADNINGQAFEIGGNTYDQCSDVRITSLRGKNCTTASNNVNLPGNGVFVGAVDWTADLLWQKDCEGGIKLGPNCARFVVSKGYVNGSLLNSTISGLDTSQKSQNSGFKIQGDETAGRVTDGIISEIISVNCGGYGVFMTSASDICIGNYRGDHNGQAIISGSVTPDWYLDVTTCDRISLRRGNISFAGGVGMNHNNGAGASICKVSYGSLSVRNSGQVSGATSKVNVDFSYGNWEIDFLHSLDDQGTPTASKGFASSGAGWGIIKSFVTKGISFARDIRNVDVTILSERIGTQALAGELTATAGTTTTLSNDNIKSAAGGSFFMEPVLELTPHNSAAVTLIAGGWRVTWANGAATIRFVNTAAATEKFRWRLAGCRAVADQAA